MLGRRKVTGSSQFIDLAERVRRRAHESPPPVLKTPANSGNHFTPQASSPGDDRQWRGRPAKVLSFSQTPLYRVWEKGDVNPEFLYQALALLEDRLSFIDDLEGSRTALASAVNDLLDEVIADLQARLDPQEKRALAEALLDELAGLGPLAPLMADSTVSEIMVNGPDKVYVKRRDRRQLTDITFRSESHLLRIARRMAHYGGRRLDETAPETSVPLDDGSKAYLIIPPLAVDGPSITIRKYLPKVVPLDQMVRQGNLSRDMATLLKVATRCRLNILISGTTASGKTTLLSALSEMIDPADRIVTIEDIPELQLLQPHTIRLETRPAGMNGEDAFGQLDLVRQSLRMRPDRLILGELFDDEAAELLLALDNGQTGLLATIHAKRPHAALRHLEDKVTYADGGVSPRTCRIALAQSIDLVVHVEQMSDGLRRVTSITEVMGMEEDNILTQELFTFDYGGADFNGRFRGRFKSAGLQPHFMNRARACGLEHALQDAL